MQMNVPSKVLFLFWGNICDERHVKCENFKNILMLKHLRKIFYEDFASKSSKKLKKALV
jgi:hypothetical protein